MNEYWIDFSGYMKVKADSKEEADTKFWDWVNDMIKVEGDYSDDVWDIDSIEEYIKGVY